MKKNIFVLGHKNPDTDSICSAISYAYLKNSISDGKYIPMRAGEISPETSFVLDYFKIKEPDYIGDISPQIKDADYSKGVVVSPDISIREAWELLHNKKNIASLNVLDKNKEIEGIVSVGDIAKFFMAAQSNDVLGKGKTPYNNIVKTLDAEVICGDIEGKVVGGKVVVAAGNVDIVKKSVEKDDIVIVADNLDIQIAAIEKEVAVIIACLGVKIDKRIIDMANESGTIVISSNEDAFITARRLNQSIPVKHFMKKEKLIVFYEDEFIEDVKEKVADIRHREFPILDETGKFKGILKKENLIDVNRKKIIMVDHNEKNQAVKGLEKGEIIEIVDHHKVGHIKTIGPVFYRNMPVGCTSTIIYTMYKEERLEIPKEIAGIMCSAILSDTLIFKSPTCTAIDKNAAEALAEIAGINLEAYALDMFSAGSDFGSRTAEEIFNLDYKKFTVGNTVYGVGQVASVNKTELDSLKERLIEHMKKVIDGGGVDMVYLMLTDIMSDSSELLCAGEKAMDIASRVFGVEGKDSSIYLEGIVSRKKQIVPQIADGLQ